MEISIPFVNEAEVILMDMGYDIGTMFTDAPHTVTTYRGTDACPIPVYNRHYRCILEMPGIGDVVFDCDAATDRPIMYSFGGSTPEAIKVSRKLQSVAA